MDNQQLPLITVTCSVDIVEIQVFALLLAKVQYLQSLLEVWLVITESFHLTQQRHFYLHSVIKQKVRDKDGLLIHREASHAHCSLTWLHRPAVKESMMGF